MLYCERLSSEVERLLKSLWQPLEPVYRVLFIKHLTDISVAGAADLCCDESQLQPSTRLIFLKVSDLTIAPHEIIHGGIVHMTHGAAG